MSEMLQAALEYAKEGFAVFPLVPNGKVPITKRGVKDATRDELTIERWWKQNPNANIGLATGQASGGVCVIDMDVKEGVNGINEYREWELNHGAFPPSWMSKTGSGGLHYLFRSPESIKNRVGLVPGIDIRADGGYIVAPPSIHQNGKRYKWIHPLDLKNVADIDDNIRFFLMQSDKAMPASRFVTPEMIPVGERNDTLFRTACSLQAKGLSDKAIYSAMQTENEEKCNPPLTTNELAKLCDSVLKKYAKGKTIHFQSDGSAVQGRREPQFALTQDGHIKKTRENMVEAIECDETMYNSIRFNQLTQNITVFGKLPWDGSGVVRPWLNRDDAALRIYLERRYGFSSPEKINDALTEVAYRGAFNPIVEELEQIYKEYGDSTNAIKELLPSYLGSEDNEYTLEALKLFMMGAICRVYHPGCKFDYTLVIYGEQGIGKSEFLRRLAIDPDWFNDNFSTLEGDKAIEKLKGYWMVEMAELRALKVSKDAETFKAFLTSRVDSYRAPYARRAEQLPRMCVFAGTTNQKNIFVDKTGNRRFLPVIARKDFRTKDLFGDSQLINEDFRKAWGEAMRLFKEANEEPRLILQGSAAESAEQMQLYFSEEDYRIGMIQDWLETNDVGKTCMPQVIENALGMNITNCSKAFKTEIAEILDNEIKGLSRVKNKNKGRLRFGKYGRQIAYIMDEDI